MKKINYRNWTNQNMSFLFSGNSCFVKEEQPSTKFFPPDNVKNNLQNFEKSNEKKKS